MIFNGLDPNQISILEFFFTKVDDYLKKTQVCIPDKIYHYTNLSAAKSIYDKREIWLFSIFDPTSNKKQSAGTIDQREVIAGIEIICDEVSSLFKKQSMNCFHLFTEMFENTLKTHYREFANVYIFCVAANPNTHLWNNVAQNDEPSCIVFTNELFSELCSKEEVRIDNSSSGQYFPFIVCYNDDELRQRIRPYCNFAIQTLKQGVGASNNDIEFMRSIMLTLSKLFALQVLYEAYGYKSSKFSVENEIRLLKIIPYGFQVQGQTKYSGRQRIIEPIGSDIPMVLLDCI